MKKNIWSILLVVALLMSLFAGCKGGETSTSTSSSTPSSVSSVSSSIPEPAVTTVVNLFGWEVPEKTIKFKVLDAAGGYARSDESEASLKTALAYYKDNFNVEIDLEKVPGSGEEAINLALASGDYPDVISPMNQNYVTIFAKQGRAVDLTPYMDTLAKDVRRIIGKTYPFLLDDDDKIWAFPKGVGALYELPDFSAHIRYDEWLAIGSPEIKTPDDYYNALNAILKMFPETPEGLSRYAMSMYGPSDIPFTYGGFWGFHGGYKIEKDGSFTYLAFAEEGKEMGKFLNRFHRDGTLDPDSLANQYAEWRAKFSSERVVGALGAFWISQHSGHEVWQEIDPDIPENKRYIQVNFTHPLAEHSYLSGKSEVPWQFSVITDKATDVEGIVKFINFQATDHGRKLVGWGIPNGVPVGDTGRVTTQWTIEKDGTWAIPEETKRQFIDGTWSYTDGGYATTSPALFSSSSRWEDGIHCIWLNQMWYSENKWKQIMIENMKGTIYNATSLGVFVPTEEYALLRTSMLDASQMNWGPIIMANTDEEFDAAWLNLQNAMEAVGIHRFAEIKAEIYRINVEKTGLTAEIINK